MRYLSLTYGGKDESVWVCSAMRERWLVVNRASFGRVRHMLKAEVFA